MSKYYILFILLLSICLNKHKNLAKRSENAKSNRLQINADWLNTRQYIYLKDLQPEERFSLKNFNAKFLSERKNVNSFSIKRIEYYRVNIEINNNPIINEAIQSLFKQVSSKYKMFKYANALNNF